MSTTQVTSQNPSPNAPKSPPRNIFEDPAIAEAAQNDPFARWVYRNKRSLIVLLVAIAASVLAYNRFTSVAFEKRASATMTLSSIQETYDLLVEKEAAVESLKGEEASKTDAKEKADLKVKIDEGAKEVDQLRDKVSLMVESLDSPKPFNLIANLYRGLLAARRKDFERTKSILAEQSWEQIGKPDSSERFIAEFLTLGLARALIDSDPHREFARTQLATLAERGAFAAVQAGSALSMLAQTDAEKTQAREIMAKLKMKFPGQQRFIADATGE